MAIRELLTKPGALVLLLSPSQRQSGELFRAKLLPLWRALGSPLKARRPSRLELELQNGSRVVSLPENEETVRCFSGVDLLAIDEGSRVDDSLYRAVRPMLAISGGALVVASTPFGQRGFFFEEWSTGGSVWERYAVTARQCPRISAQFLAEERLKLGERWFKQEYFLAFNDAVDQLLPQSVIDRAMGLGV